MLNSYCLSCREKVFFEITKPKICPKCGESMLGASKARVSSVSSPKAQGFEIEESEGPDSFSSGMRGLDFETMAAGKKGESMKQILSNECSQIEAGRKKPSRDSRDSRESSNYGISDMQREGGFGQRKESPDEA